MATTDEKRSQLDHDLDLFARINEPDPPLGECLRAAGSALAVGIATYFMGALIKTVPSPAPYDADVVAWGGFGILMVCCIVALLAVLSGFFGGALLRAVAAYRFLRLPPDRKDAVTAVLTPPAAESGARRVERRVALRRDRA